MGWVVEQNTGAADFVIRCVWFKGYIYAFTQDDGVWRRDGIGPWVHVFNGPIGGGGTGWYWEADDALYCGDSWNIYRSIDGVTWVIDVNLAAAPLGLQAFYHSWSEIGGYGDYLYLANHDVAGAGATFFYRRDLAGNWAAFGAPHAGVEGAQGRGIIGFGDEVYWTNALWARYWDGAAWSIEPTLEDQGGTYMSVIDNKLYVCTDPSHSLVGGYYWKTTAATTWAFMNLPIPDNTWWVWTLCEGADGEMYTLTSNGTIMRIYQQVGPLLNLIAYQAVIAVGVGTRGGICVDATGEMFWGTRAGGTIQFFRFVGVYTVVPCGLYPQAMDCDGDGDQLYLALCDTGTTFPLLISVALPLIGGVSAGSAIFNPGAGTAINVRALNIGDNVAISGHFGNNEQVEVTTDAGLNWTDVDPGTWAANLAQPLLVAPCTLDEIVVALSALQDLMETEDGGTTWIQRNAAIGYSPGAAARLEEGDEIILGDDGANRIDYSPNRGVILQNVTGVFAGNVASLAVA